MMIINHNISALNTHRTLNVNKNAVDKSLEKLSSGLRINRAGNDVAGLAISEKMRGQIRGLKTASTNAQDTISLIQTAEGGLNETHAILQRMRELVTQSANDTNTNSDRAELQKEVDQLAQELSRISNDTEFNTKNLLGGNFTGTFHIGANSNQNMELSIPAMDAYSLGVARSVIESTATVAPGTTHIDSVTINQGGLGSLVVDGANITFHYDSSPATAAQLTAPNEVEPRNIGVGATTTMSITVDGTDVFTFNSSELNNLVGSETADDLANMIDTKIGATGTATVDNNRIVITSASTGSSSSIEVAFTGSGEILVAPIFGFETSSASATGSDAVDATITVSNGDSTEDVTFNITDSSTATFTTGNDAKFGGLTISLGGTSNLTNLVASTESVNIAIDEELASTPASWDPDTGEMTKAIVLGGIDISNQSAANTAMTTIQEAINKVSLERSKLGAYQNRLEYTINNLSVSAENLTTAESRITDNDMAKEMMKFTKNNILTQAAQMILAQANQTPQGILQLLR